MMAAIGNFLIDVAIFIGVIAAAFFSIFLAYVLVQTLWSKTMQIVNFFKSLESTLKDVKNMSETHSHDIYGVKKDIKQLNSRLDDLEAKLESVREFLGVTQKEQVKQNEDQAVSEYA
jgi:Co/Zn/Cd efflux system component